MLNLRESFYFTVTLKYQTLLVHKSNIYSSHEKKTNMTQKLRKELQSLKTTETTVATW